MKPEKHDRSEVVLFQAGGGITRLEVRLDKETVRLNQEQMADRFDRKRSVVTKHLQNIFKEGELEESAVRAKYAHTAFDEKSNMQKMQIANSAIQRV